MTPSYEIVIIVNDVVIASDRTSLESGMSLTREPLRTIQIPMPRTPIVGRERELIAVRDLLARRDVPLVSLIGPGGVGKTRLAIELARSVAGDFPDGVYFVGLSNISDPALIAPTIARTVGIVQLSGQPAEETLSVGLRDLQTLLVLDNFEQVVSGAPSIAALLESAQEVKVVVTSRSPLRVHGEYEFPVEPLALSPEEIARRTGALALFAERANAVNPAFKLTPENAAVVAQICAKLDGLPLAIELAAARMKLLTPEALLVRLDEGLAILSSGNRDAPERQQTLTNTIAWSYGLLTAFERWLFRRLGVFAGGFSFEAAAAVAADWVAPERSNGSKTTNGHVDAANNAATIDEIGALIEQSLLRRADAPDGQPRIAMLHTIREFALEQLEFAGELREARLAHARFFLDQLSLGYTMLKSPREVEWLAWFGRETDNVRAAIASFNEYGEKESALTLLGRISSFWAGRIALREIDGWVQHAFELPGEVSYAAQFAGLLAGCWVKMFQGMLVAARDFANRALELAERSNDSVDLIKVRNLLGGMAVHGGDLGTARAEFSEGLHLAELSGVPQQISVLHNLGLVEMLSGNLDEALVIFERAVERARGFGDRIGVSLCQIRIAQIAVVRGQLAEAAKLNRGALPTMWEAGHTIGYAESIGVEAVIAERLGDDERAFRYVGVAIAVLDSVDEFDVPVSNAFRDQFEAIRARMPGGPSPHAMQPSHQEIEEIVRDVLALPIPVTSQIAPKPLGAGGAGDLQLTPREIEIVRLLARGRTNQEMADDLFISLRTVQTHVSNILTKLKLTSRAAIAAFAVRSGLE